MSSLRSDYWPDIYWKRPSPNLPNFIRVLSTIQGIKANILQIIIRCKKYMQWIQGSTWVEKIFRRNWSFCPEKYLKPTTRFIYFNSDRMAMSVDVRLILNTRQKCVRIVFFTAFIKVISHHIWLSIVFTAFILMKSKRRF